MRYRLSGENDIDASLAFKLDPAIARLFGRNGVDLVQAAKGTLVDAEITGIDAGAAIGQLTGQRARAADEQRRIAAELARPGLPASERAELQNQRAELARRIEAATAAFSEGARTGMVRLREHAATTSSGRPEPSDPTTRTSLPPGTSAGGEPPFGMAAAETKPPA